MKKAGFTLVELLVVFSILGILAATALPFYNTFKRRTHGAEARLLLKQILDAEIIYFLEHNTFFPNNNVYIVTHSGKVFPQGQNVVNNIWNALNLSIPVGHFLDFTITAPGGNLCIITISSPQRSFPLFRNGDKSIMGVVDKTGKIDYDTF